MCLGVRVSVGERTPTPSIDAQRLPAALRVWSVVGRGMPYSAKRAGALALSRRLLEPHRLYRSPGGFLLGIDSTDPFQSLMVTGPAYREMTRIACRSVRPG